MFAVGIFMSYAHNFNREPLLLHTCRLGRTMAVWRRAQSTCRASLSRLWSFRKPSTTSTVTHLVPVFHLQRFVQMMQASLYTCPHAFLVVLYLIASVFFCSFPHQAFPPSFSSSTWRVESFSSPSGEHRNSPSYEIKDNVPVVMFMMKG